MSRQGQLLCHCTYRLHENGILRCSLSIELFIRNEGRMTWIKVQHPRHPSVVHILTRNSGPESKGQNGIASKQGRGVSLFRQPIGINALLDFVSNVIEIVLSSHCQDQLPSRREIRSKSHGITSARERPWGIGYVASLRV